MAADPAAGARIGRVGYALPILPSLADAAIGRHQGLLAKVLRYMVIGLAVTAVYDLAVVILTHWQGVAALESAVIAYCLAAPFSYLGHRFYTFCSDAKVRPELTRFLLAAPWSFAASLAGMFVMTSLLGLPAIAGALAATVLVPLGNFLILSYRVFLPSPAGS
ncbi:MAG TPA: GtrA family protein [Dehalococcoidia bacterium]|nr:GtrA family protein [Dehalococcoidia bacterium]